MQSIKYAIRFISLSFQLAKENEQLQKPWMYLSFGCLGLLLFWFIPFALVIGLIGLNIAGVILIGLISILVLFSFFVWGEMTALKTCQIFNDTLQKSDQTPDIKGDYPSFMKYWWDMVILQLSLPGATLYHAIRQWLAKDSASNSDWWHAHSLLLPAIALEDQHLTGAVNRVKSMVKDNLLRVRSDLIRVSWIARGLEGFMFAAGITMGFMMGFFIDGLIEAKPGGAVVGTGAGLLLGGIFISLGLAFSTFTRACYHTALYLWAWNVEASRRSEDRSQASPPLILSQVLGKSALKKKER